MSENGKPEVPLYSVQVHQLPGGRVVVMAPKGHELHIAGLLQYAIGQVLNHFDQVNQPEESPILLPKAGVIQ